MAGKKKAKEKKKPYPAHNIRQKTGQSEGAYAAGKGKREAAARRVGKNSAKKQSRARISRMLWASARKAKEETFEPAPASQERIEPEPKATEQKIEVPQSAAEKSIERKKSIPHALSAIVGAVALTAIIGALLLWMFQLGPLLAAGIIIPFFVGFSILFYNFLEGKMEQ